MNINHPTRPVALRLLHLTVAVFAAGLVACEKPPGPPSLAGSEPDVARAQPPADQETDQPTPAELFGIDLATWEYRITEGDGEGRVVQTELTRADDDALPFRRERHNNRVEHLAIAEDGSIVLGAVEDHNDGVITRYQPPLTIVPADLPTDGPQEYTTRMEVRNIDPPHRVRGEGEATRTIEYVGREEIDSPAGTFDAQRFDVTYHAEMPIATIDIDATEWYSPQTGLVAEQVDENVRAALLFNRSTQQTLRLNSLPAPRVSKR